MAVVSSLCFRRNAVTDLSDAHPFLISLYRALLLSSPTTILPEDAPDGSPTTKQHLLIVGQAQETVSSQSTLLLHYLTRPRQEMDP